MGNVRDDDKASYGGTEHDHFNTKAIVAFIEDTMRDAISKAKAEIAAECEARGGSSDKDIRMQCISLVVAEGHGKTFPVDDPAGRADVLAQYVLTGKKPGEA
jgi:hypothetical protein